MNSNSAAGSSAGALRSAKYHDDVGDHTKSGPDGVHVEEIGYEALRMESTDSQLPEPQIPVYRTYKRRYFGLVQLILMNVMVSWDWLTFAAVSNLASAYYGVSEADINWLSTGVLFAFAFSAPFTIWTINRYGIKTAICVAAFLLVVGNVIRYGGSRADNGGFAAVVIGQVIIGLSQPFVLASPSFFANVWFSDQGRVTAIAVTSLANPLGGALGQLIGPFWATDPKQIPSMVLYIFIISAAVCLPAPFLPNKPPTPPSAVAASEKLDLVAGFRDMARNLFFWLIMVPFSIYVGFFNAFSSLINQIFLPYGFSETDAGIAGALLIVVGLVAAAITSPIIDRTKAYIPTVKIIVPLVAICYLIMIWMPQTRTVAGPYVLCAILGATSFALLPCVLEVLAIITHPVPPEISSTVAWTGGQVLGGIFILIMTALTSKNGWDGQPPGTLQRALIFEAIVAWVALPFPLLIGYWKFKDVESVMRGPALQRPRI